MTDHIDPMLPVWLERGGATVDGEPDRSWFEAECQRSRLAMQLGREERDRELQRILDGE